MYMIGLRQEGRDATPERHREQMEQVGGRGANGGVAEWEEARCHVLLLVGTREFVFEGLRAWIRSEE